MPDLADNDLRQSARAAFSASDAERALSIPDWADLNLHIPRGTGLTPHRSSVTPYWAHPQRMIQQRITGSAGPFRHVERITIITGTQVGKTFGMLVPTLAWVTAVHPRDLAIYLPGDAALKKFARTKLDKTFRESPRLATLLPHGMAEQAKRLTVKGWLLDRSTMYFKNGRKAIDLKSDDVPFQVADEFNLLPTNVDDEGNPCEMMADRGKTFPAEYCQLQITTPTEVAALGWSQFVTGSMEQLLIACAKCGAHHWLDPDLLEPTAKGLSPDALQIDDAVAWRCKHCGHRHTTDQRDAQVALACARPGVTAAGGWVPSTWEQASDGTGAWVPRATWHASGKIKTADEATSIHRSLWLNSLYSQFVSCGKFYGDGLRAKQGQAGAWQVHVNSYRAEPFLPLIDGAQAHDLAAIEITGDGYQHRQCPFAAKHVVLTCDQQGAHVERAWFPYVVRAWAETGESWLVEAGTAKDWAALDGLTTKTWPVNGVARAADVIALDTANGPMVRHCRRWLAKDPRKRLSLQGNAGMSPDYPYTERRPDHKSQAKTMALFCGLPALYTFNANLFRDDVFDRLRAATGLPGWHIPGDAPAFYRESLQSEERIARTAMSRGRQVSVFVWQPKTYVDPQGIPHTRSDNHWWDCEVMQCAVITIKNWIRGPRTPSAANGGQVGGGDAGWMDGYR